MAEFQVSSDKVIAQLKRQLGDQAEQIAYLFAAVEMLSDEIGRLTQNQEDTHAE